MSTSNDVKVYNLSAGKSLPEWISDRKKRILLKNDLGEFKMVPENLNFLCQFSSEETHRTDSRLLHACDGYGSGCV